MSNLVKYIHNINESELKGNKGEIYENLISLALNFLILKKKDKSIQTTIEELMKNPIEIFQLEKLSEKLGEIIDKGNLVKKDINDANEIFKEINSLIKLKKIEDTKIKFAQVKNIRTLIRRKNLLDGLLNKEDKYLEKLKETFHKEEYKEFIKIEEEDLNDYKEKKKTHHRVAYEIAKNIKEYLETQKNETIIRVANIGLRNGEISYYWGNLFSNVNKSSKVKTDIILETLDKTYNLSLKMNDNRFGTPKYVDIYTLILHAINILLEKNRDIFITELNKNKVTNKDDIEKNFLIEKDKKLSQIKNKLKEILEINEEETDAYITIINISMMIDLIFIRKNITYQASAVNILNIFTEIIKNPSELREIFNELKELTITDENIEKISFNLFLI
jgi:hypothetical protein